MSKEIFGEKQKAYFANAIQPTPKLILFGLVVIWGFISIFSWGVLQAPPEVEVEKYVVQKNEIVILKDTRTNVFTVHTFGDTLEVEAYQYIASYPKVANFYFGDVYRIPKETLPKETLPKGSYIEF